MDISSSAAVRAGQAMPLGASARAADLRRLRLYCRRSRAARRRRASASARRGHEAAVCVLAEFQLLRGHDARHGGSPRRRVRRAILRPTASRYAAAAALRSPDGPSAAIAFAPAVRCRRRGQHCCAAAMQPASSASAGRHFVRMISCAGHEMRAARPRHRLLGQAGGGCCLLATAARTFGAAAACRWRCASSRLHCAAFAWGMMPARVSRFARRRIHAGKMACDFTR